MTPRPTSYSDVYDRLGISSFRSLNERALAAQNISPSTAYVMKLVEDSFILVRGLVKANSTTDYSFAIVTFAKLRSDKSLSELMINYWKEVFPEQLQSSSFNVFTKMRGLLDNYDAVKKLPIFKKVYKFFMYCISLSLFEKVGIKFDFSRYLLIERAALNKEFYAGPDFIHCMLDTTLYVLEVGYDCMVTGSLEPIYHSESAYDKWFSETELLKLQSKHLTNPTPHGFTIFDYINRLDTCIEQGRSIVKYHKHEPAALRVTKYMLNELLTLRADFLTKKMAQQDRKAPFAVLVSGGTSVGKSSFTKMLFYHYGKYFNLPIDPEYRFVRNFFDQYWSNFNTSQWCIQLDDIAFLHPNAANGVDPSLMEMLQVVNNVPYVPAQADIQDKGRTPLRARLVIATTNTEKLNAESYFACPLAVQRRLPYVIDISPKTEYSLGGCMLDESKIPQHKDGEYPDFWRIVVKKVVPNKSPSLHMGQTGSFEVVGIFDFLKWFNKVASIADAVQDKAMNYDDHMHSANLCDCGVPLKQCPTCTSSRTHPDHIESSESETETHTDAFLQSDEVEVDTGDMERIQTARAQTRLDNINSAFSQMSLDEQTTWVEEMLRRQDDSFAEMPDYMDPAPTFTSPEAPWIEKAIVWWYNIILWMCTYSWWTQYLTFLFFGPLSKWITLLNCVHLPGFRYFFIKWLGYRAYNKIRRSRVHLQIVAAITACATFLAGYRIYQNFSAENIESVVDEKVAEQMVQGRSSEVGVTPPSTGDKNENVWYKDRYEVSKFDVSLASVSRAKWTIDDAVEILSANLVSVDIKIRISADRLKKFTSRGVCLGGMKYLFNNHSFVQDHFELTMINSQSKDGVNSNVTMLVTPAQIERFPEKDIIILTLPLPPRRKILSFFPKPTYEGKFDGEYVMRNADGSICRTPVRLLEKTPIIEMDNLGLEHKLATSFWRGYSETMTHVGDCGSLLIANSAYGPQILGFHILSTNAQAVSAVALDSDFVGKILHGEFDASAPQLQVGEYKTEIIELSKKSPIRYLSEGTAEVYGSLSGFRGKMRSAVTKTYISDHMVKLGYKRETFAPEMRSWKPWRIALQSMTNPVMHMDVTALYACRDAFLKDILNGLTKEDLAEVMVYDTFTAVNGAAGVAYVDK